MSDEIEEYNQAALEFINAISMSALVNNGLPKFEIQITPTDREGVITVNAISFKFKAETLEDSKNTENYTIRITGELIKK